MPMFFLLPLIISLGVLGVTQSEMRPVPLKAKARPRR